MVLAQNNTFCNICIKFLSPEKNTVIPNMLTFWHCDHNTISLPLNSGTLEIPTFLGYILQMGKNMDYLNKILPLSVKVNNLLRKQISHCQSQTVAQQGSGNV